MNRQVHYIVYASLLLLLIFCVSLLLRHFTTETSQENQSQTISDYKTENSIPEIKPSSSQGKTLFQSKCASCHNLFKDATGPGLFGFQNRGPWGDKKNIYEWIRNPSAFMKGDKYTQALKTAYGSMMSAFPDLSDEEIDAICEYINYAEKINYSIPVAER